jgi:ATP-dependent Clp protease, protease subunit
MANKKKDKAKRKRKVDKPLVIKHEIKIEQINLHSRQVFLTGVIDEEKAHEIVTTLTALASYHPSPIVMWINSNGGSIYDGFAIMDIMESIPCPIITVIQGKACSMGGIISLYGDKRFITKNSVFMAHDVSSGNWDYVTKMKDRFVNTEKLQSQVFQMLRDRTKLTEQDLEKARHGELWLDAEECLKKGIVDEILMKS